MPSASTAPMPMNTQGLASYKVLGVQDRIPLVYSQRRRTTRFVTMTQYAFFAIIRAPEAIAGLVPRDRADRTCPGVRLRPHARAHFLCRLLAPRALRGREHRAHVPKP